MSATHTLTPQAQWYLDEVRRALADLPETERDELLADVETHVVEVSLEDGDELVARLGPPDGFAAELRAAAGLPGHRPPPPVPKWRRLRELAAWLHTHAAKLSDLAPAGWILRGYIAAVLFCAILGGGWPQGWIPEAGSDALGLIVVLAAIAGSVWLGRRTRDDRLGRAPRNALRTANVLGVVAGIFVATQLGEPQYVYSEPIYEEPGAGLTLDGIPVGNIYPVDRRGRPLYDVRLFDESGRPLAINPDDQDPSRRVVEDASGARADNAFPIRHLDPSTDDVGDPTAGFPKDVPPLATPPVVEEQPPARKPERRRKRR